MANPSLVSEIIISSSLTSPPVPSACLPTLVPSLSLVNRLVLHHVGREQIILYLVPDEPILIYTDFYYDQLHRKLEQWMTAAEVPVLSTIVPGSRQVNHVPCISPHQEKFTVFNLVKNHCIVLGIAWKHEHLVWVSGSNSSKQKSIPSLSPSHSVFTETKRLVNKRPQSGFQTCFLYKGNRFRQICSQWWTSFVQPIHFFCKTRYFEYDPSW